MRRIFNENSEHLRIAYENDYGVTVTFSNFKITTGIMIAILLGTTVIAIIISIIRARNIKFK